MINNNPGVLSALNNKVIGCSGGFPSSNRDPFTARRQQTYKVSGRDLFSNTLFNRYAQRIMNNVSNAPQMTDAERI
jgi:hypothetical protein